MISRLFSFTASVVIFAATAASAQSIVPEALAAEASGELGYRDRAAPGGPSRESGADRLVDPRERHRSGPAESPRLDRGPSRGGAHFDGRRSGLREAVAGARLAGQPAEALAAIEIAVAQSPDSVEYLRAKATLATWSADYRLRTGQLPASAAGLQPEDEDLFLQLRAGQRLGWRHRRGGRLRIASSCASAPENAAVWIELAKAESWRGNYAAAAEALETYRKRFGTSPAYDRAHAAVMASGGRPRAARTLWRRFWKRRPKTTS